MTKKPISSFDKRLHSAGQWCSFDKRQPLLDPRSQAQGFDKRQCNEGKNQASSSKAMKVKKEKEYAGKARKDDLSAEGADTVANLKGLLSREEHSKVWSDHEVQDKQREEGVCKPDQDRERFAGCHALGQNLSAKFMQCKESLGQPDTLTKWEPETVLATRPIDMGGCATIVIREISQKHTARKKEWTRGQEYQPGEEENEEFDGLCNMDGSGHMQQVEGRGTGKSKALTKGNGQGGGKGKGKKGRGGGPLAIKDKEDGEEEEEEEAEKNEEKQWKEVLTRPRRKSP